MNHVPSSGILCDACPRFDDTRECLCAGMNGTVERLTIASLVADLLGGHLDRVTRLNSIIGASEEQWLLLYCRGTKGFIVLAFRRRSSPTLQLVGVYLGT